MALAAHLPGRSGYLSELWRQHALGTGRQDRTCRRPLDGQARYGAAATASDNSSFARATASAVRQVTVPPHVARVRPSSLTVTRMRGARSGVLIGNGDRAGDALLASPS